MDVNMNVYILLQNLKVLTDILQYQTHLEA